MAKIVRAVLFALVIATAARAQQDACKSITDCEQCVSHSLCGWCSTDVDYKNGTKGGQCAGVQQGVSPPFECNGIFSTEQCFAGYTCDESDFTCKLAAPGEGNTLQKCEANCTNTGKVFLCNHTVLKCYPVAPGTPGSSSEGVCEASCAHPSAHPSPPTSPKPSSQLYACNTTTGTCDEAPVGKGEAKEVCETECKKVDPNAAYMCNTALKQCIKLPSGTPGGETLATCEAACNPTPAPGPPSELVGFYRGIQIQKGYVTGTFDLDVNESVVTFVAMSAGKVTSHWAGTPGHIVMPDKEELTIALTDGPDAGKTVNALGVFGTPGPETKHLTMAISAPGGDMPTSIEDAMTAGNGITVYAFSQCQSADCKFTLPPMVLNKMALRHRRAHRRMHRTSADADHCAAFAANCSLCLTQPFCGWCSVDVDYKDGTRGTQCAGFNNANGTGPAFQCNGRYSTFNCTEGYLCDHTDNQCKATTPGNGMPQAECEQFCHPTPPPTPPQPMAICNLTTKQCHPCPDNATHCPGSLPKGACEAQCSSHKKGPHAAVVGVWRGMYIQNGYKRVEVDVVFDNTSATFVQVGQAPMKCNVTSLGSDLMIFDVVSGQYKGWKFAAMYQSAPQPGGIYETMTLAAGKLGSGAPSSFDGAMSTQGDHVYVLDKCQGSGCDFKNPIQ